LKDFEHGRGNKAKTSTLGALLKTFIFHYPLGFSSKLGIHIKSHEFI
jgi:hypothetical protein